MDCLNFSNWLANRDTYDISEADKAIKHSATCPDCSAKLRFDEQVDTYVSSAMEKIEVPASLRAKVDLSLDSISDEQSKKKLGWYGAVSAALAAMVVFALSFTITPSIPSVDEMGKYVIYDHSHHGDSILAIDDPADISKLTDVSINYQQITKKLSTDSTFVGGRICPLGDCQAIHLVYSNNGKRVSLYLIKTSDVDFSLSPGKQYTMQDNNQTVNFWQEGDFVFAMIG